MSGDIRLLSLVGVLFFLGLPRRFIFWFPMCCSYFVKILFYSEGSGYEGY